MRKAKLDESDPPHADPKRTGGELPETPAPPLVILAIDDDPGMLGFYKAALSSPDVRLECSMESNSRRGIGGNPQP